MTARTPTKKVSIKPVKQVRMFGKGSSVLGVISDDIEISLIVNDMLGFDRNDFAQRFMDAYDKLGDPLRREEVEDKLKQILSPLEVQ